MSRNKRRRKQRRKLRRQRARQALAELAQQERASFEERALAGFFASLAQRGSQAVASGKPASPAMLAYAVFDAMAYAGMPAMDVIRLRTAYDQRDDEDDDGQD